MAVIIAPWWGRGGWQMAVDWVPNVAVVATVTERRRVGRSVGTSPNLIPLLRGSATLIEAHADPDLVRFGSDQSAPARGIMIGVLLSGVIWAGIVLAISALL